MSKEIAEQAMSDEQLEKVTGGTGVETMAVLQRIKEAGYATVRTPIAAGYEKEAAAELRSILNGLQHGAGATAFKGTRIYEDDENANVYKVCGKVVTMNGLLNHMRIMLGK